MAPIGRRSRNRPVLLPDRQFHATRLLSALHVDTAGTNGRRPPGGAAETRSDVDVADIATRATSGAIWTYASYTTARVLVFVGMAVVARLLRPEEYGLFSMAAVATNLLEGSYDLGLRRGLIYCGGALRSMNVLGTGFVLSLGAG